METRMGQPDAHLHMLDESSLECLTCGKGLIELAAEGVPRKDIVVVSYPQHWKGF
jgi:hypothetical protein